MSLAAVNSIGPTAMDTGPPPVSHRPLRPPWMCSPTSALLLALRFGSWTRPEGTCNPGGRRHAPGPKVGSGRSGEDYRGNDEPLGNIPR